MLDSTYCDALDRLLGPMFWGRRSIAHPHDRKRAEELLTNLAETGKARNTTKEDIVTHRC